MENKIVGTNTPEEERGYRETQATRLRHTESPEHSVTERQEQPGPCRARGHIRNLGFYSRKEKSIEELQELIGLL